MRPERRRRVYAVALFAVLGAGSAQGAETAELDDAAARLQYAYYTADIRALEDVLALLEGFEVAESLASAKSYHLAYGRWKLAQSYVDEQSQQRGKSEAKSLAAKAAQACTQHAEAAVRQDSRLAEAYAIDAVCSALLQDLRAAMARTKPTGSCARSRSLRTALSLAPSSPRVRLIEALCSDHDDAAAAELVVKWRAVVASFEAAPPSRPGRPDWGHAEALAALGESHLSSGDSLAARDALERALVIAPDYHRAKKLLQTAATRPK